MAFSVIQAGTTLYSFNTDGGSVALTLPTGITLRSERVPRFARFGRYVIVVNTPSRPLTVDGNGNVRVLTPLPPTLPLTLSAGASGGLTGSYLAKQTFITLDASGNIISESDYGPVPASPTVISAKRLRVTNISLSTDAITSTRLYRTATGPTQSYFKWIDVPDNTVTAIEDDTPDAGLSIVAAPILGSAPDLTLCVEWQGRLWGVDRQDIDNLRYTEAGMMYAWSALNTIPIPHIGEDAYGIMALIPRRHALGIARVNQLIQVTGTSTANLSPTMLKEQCGCLSQETVVTYNDTAYWLWRDGVYKWNDEGVVCISDAKVRSWFTTDTYFNRAMFYRSFAVFNPVTSTYRLFLASAGSNVIDRWVEYDLTTGTWWGPHLTKAFNPKSAFIIIGTNGQPYPMVGTLEGYLAQDIETKSDWGIMSIPMDVIGRVHDAGFPDLEKYWGELSMISPVQSSGNLIITPSVGDTYNFAVGAAISSDMTRGRNRLRRIGFGQLAQLRFTHDVINEDAAVNGYELPFIVVGRR